MCKVSAVYLPSGKDESCPHFFAAVVDSDTIVCRPIFFDGAEEVNN